MNLPEFVTKTTDGEILLTGHRIGLVHVVHYYNEGFSPEMLVCQFPTLSLSLIHRVIAFYLDNRGEVDAYAAGCRTELNRQRENSDRHLDLNALRERLGSRHKSETTSGT